jgi:SOS-response transcriptional repressor LexA
MTSRSSRQADNDPTSARRANSRARHFARFGEITSGVVKHVHRDGGNLRLVSSNPEYEDIILTPDRDPVIIGKVIGVVRRTN